LYRPALLTVDSNENVLVADGNGRIQKFTSAGVYSNKLGQPRDRRRAVRGLFGHRQQVLALSSSLTRRSNRVQKFGDTSTPVRSGSWGSLKRLFSIGVMVRACETCGVDRYGHPHERASNRRDVGAAAQRHRHFELGLQQLEHVLHARLRRSRLGPTGRAARRAPRGRPVASALSTWAPRRTPPSTSTGGRARDGLDHSGQGVEPWLPRHRAAGPPWFETITPVDTGGDGASRIVGSDDALEQQRHSRHRLEPSHRVPGERRIEGSRRLASHGAAPARRPRVVPARGRRPGSWPRAMSSGKREAIAQVALAPAQHRRVHGQHQGTALRRLGAAHQMSRDVSVLCGRRAGTTAVRPWPGRRPRAVRVDIVLSTMSAPAAAAPRAVATSPSGLRQAVVRGRRQQEWASTRAGRAASSRCRRD